MTQREKQQQRARRRTADAVWYVCCSSCGMTFDAVNTREEQRQRKHELCAECRALAKSIGSVAAQTLEDYCPVCGFERVKRALCCSSNVVSRLIARGALRDVCACEGQL